MRQLLALLVVVSLASTAVAGEFVATERDFQCLLDWTRPDGHKLRVFNRNPKRLRKALKIVAQGRPGRHHPKGTILQLIPQEAMVKRGGRFNRDGGGWEFFSLRGTPTGTEIVARGGPEVTNVFTHSSCQTCHAKGQRFDLVCETDHGCDPLPAFVTAGFVDLIQHADQRCGP